MLSHRSNKEFGRRKEPHRIIIAHGDVVQDFKIRPWVFTCIMGIGVLFSVLYLSATAYLVFRDEIISFSRSEQAMMQNAYEDRIAELRSQLDRVSSRQMLDQQEMESLVQELMRKQADYEAYSSVLGPILQKAHKAGVKISSDVKIPVPRPAPWRKKQAAINTDEITGSIAAESGTQIARADVTSRFDDLSALGFRSSKFFATEQDTSSSIQMANALPLGLAKSDLPDAPKETENNKTILQLADAANRLEADMLDKNAILFNILHDIRKKTAHVEKRIAALGVKIKPVNEAIGGPFIPLAYDGDADKLARDAEKVAMALDHFMQLKRSLQKLPISNPLPSGRLTSRFGPRRDPFLNRMSMHAGIDVADSYGTPIRAAGGGKVIYAGPRSGYGRMVEIDHGNGIVSRYGHMSKVLAKNGQMIEKGDRIGKVGSSGRSTGPHLHFETRIKGKAVNPYSFLMAGNDLRKMI